MKSPLHSPKRLPAVIFARYQPWCALLCIALLICAFPCLARGDSAWEITPQSRKALDRGLQWLQRNQGPEGNWTTNNLGLVSMGVLAFWPTGTLRAAAAMAQRRRRPWTTCFAMPSRRDS